MSEDITPGLLKKIQDDFQENFDKSSVISDLYKKVRDGTATYKEANEFAIEVGDILAGAYRNNLSSAVLPNGKMYYNIAQRIIEPTMKRNYELITDVTNQVQTALNKSAKIGVKAIQPKLNLDRIHGIVNKVSNAEIYDDVAWALDEPIKVFSQSIVDDAIKENAEFQHGSGMSPKIVRTSTGKCCDWCDKVAGVHDYEKVRDTGNAVFRRHQYCRCIVLFDPADGRNQVQNAHSKKWKNIQNNDKIETRKEIGLDYAKRKLRNVKFRTANMSREEFARGKKLWKEYKELPLSRREKEYVYEEFDNNLSVEEKECCMVRRAIGNYWYRAIHLGHNQYKIIGKEAIEPFDDIVDEVLSEMFGRDWRSYL